MLVKFDTNTGKPYLAFIRQIKDNLTALVPVSDEVKKGLNQIFNEKELGGKIQDLADTDGTFQTLAEQCKVTDKNFAKFFETTQQAGTVYQSSEEALKGYQKYLVSTGQAAVTTTAKTKLLTMAGQALSSLGWAALFTALTWAASKGIEAISNYIHRFELAKELRSDLLKLL